VSIFGAAVDPCTPSQRTWSITAEITAVAPIVAAAIFPIGSRLVSAASSCTWSGAARSGVDIGLAGDRHDGEAGASRQQRICGRHSIAEAAGVSGRSGGFCN